MSVITANRIVAVSKSPEQIMIDDRKSRSFLDLNLLVLSLFCLLGVFVQFYASNKSYILQVSIEDNIVRLGKTRDI
jgi:hypothetical protein